MARMTIINNPLKQNVAVADMMITAKTRKIVSAKIKLSFG